MNSSIDPMTEEDIVEFLLQTPEFFERQADMLASVQLFSPHGNRAVGLQERQAEILRERIKMHERNIMDMVRHGNENMLISSRIQQWTEQLLPVSDPADLPAVLTRSLGEVFHIPQVALKLWRLSAEHAQAPWAQGVTRDIQSLTQSMPTPYCGLNTGFEAAQCLPEPEAARSLALLPLRCRDQDASFGLLVLASPDETRFDEDMGTAFLQDIADLAAAALSRLCSSCVDQAV